MNGATTHVGGLTHRCSHVLPVRAPRRLSAGGEGGEQASCEAHVRAERSCVCWLLTRVARVVLTAPIRKPRLRVEQTMDDGLAMASRQQDRSGCSLLEFD